MSTTDIRDAQIDDGIQHGIDDNPHDDAKKGAALGGVGGAAVGAAAGAMVGPIGAVIGAVVGGVSGAAASGAAVAAIDDIDNDNNITGLGEDTTADVNSTDGYTAANPPVMNDPYLATTAPLDPVVADDRYAVSTPPLGNDIPGVQTGGRAIDGTPDTRGLSEKAADAITGDPIDDKTGKPVAGAAGTTARY
jgi:hypothetical protein